MSKRKQLSEKSLLRVLLLAVFSKVIPTLSPSPSLSCFPSLLLLSLCCSPSQSLHPSTPTSPFSLLSSALAACQRLCCGRTRHWGLKLSTDVPRDKRRWSTRHSREKGERYIMSWKVDIQYYLRSDRQSWGVKYTSAHHTERWRGDAATVSMEHLCHADKNVAGPVHL